MAEGLKLDDLQIDIVVNASKASSALQDLSAAFRDVGSASKALKDVSKNVQSLGKGAEEAEKQTEKLNDSLSETGKSGDDAAKGIKKAGDEAEKSAGKFQTFVKSIGRIAMYRAIRTAIKTVTQAVSEGFNMFVTWDREQNNSMAGAANAVDKLKASWTQLKGSIGALGGTLATTFLPIITKIIDGLTKMVDLLQMVVRSLQGEYTYYKLIYNEASASVGAAKELKRTLFGFDELNVLPSLSGGGVSTNSGSWAYEPVPIDSKLLNGIADISNKIQEFFGISDEGQKIIGGLAGAFGVLLGAKALGGLAGMLPSLITGLKQKNNALSNQASQTQADTSAVKALSPALAAALGAATAFGTYLKRNPIIVTTKVEAIAPKLVSAYNTAKQWLFGKALSVNTAIQSILTGVYNSWVKAKNWLTGKALVVNTAIQSILAKAYDSWVAAKRWLSKQVLNVSTKVQSILSGVYNSWVKAKNWLTGKYLVANTAVQSIASKVESAWSSAKNWLSGKTLTFNTAISANVNALSGVLSGVISTLQAAANANPIVIPTIVGGAAESGSSSLASSGSMATASGISAKESNFLTRFNSLLPTFKDQLNALGVSVPKPLYSSMWTYSQNSAATNLANWLKETASSIPMNPAFNGVTSISEFMTILKSLLPAYMLKALALANGGVVDTGSLFIAGEQGAEIVANMGSGRTGVMNVAQMEDAVANGNIAVVNAIYSLINTVNGKNFDIYMDSAKVGQSVTNYQNNQMRRGVAY